MLGPLDGSDRGGPHVRRRARQLGRLRGLVLAAALVDRPKEQRAHPEQGDGDPQRGTRALRAADEVEKAWAIVTPILEAWIAEEDPHIPIYPAGTWGPPEADELMARDGRRWRRL